MLDTTLFTLLGWNALKHPIQGRTGPVVPQRTPGQSSVAKSHLAAVLMKSLFWWDEHSDTCQWVLQQLAFIQVAVQIKCWVWSSWTHAKTSQPLTYLKWISTSCTVPHTGTFMWNLKNKGNYQPWMVIRRCWEVCLHGDSLHLWFLWELAKLDTEHLPCEMLLWDVLA